eukprot:m.81926 g.81926  ORF g.81926 m.81926 type:complete len:240 (+) comp12660_c0_seq1:35-754(+)
MGSLLWFVAVGVGSLGGTLVGLALLLRFNEKLSHRFFSFIWQFLSHGVDAKNASLKRELFSTGAHGRVLDIGSGYGVNFKYFAKLPQITSVVAVEPNVHLHEQLLANSACLQEANVPFTFVPDVFPSSKLQGKFDTIVCCLVLCSIPDYAGAIKQMYSMLNEGGKLIVLEHVGDQPYTLRWIIQRTLDPLWHCLGDGCHLSRVPQDVIRSLKWQDVSLTHFEADMFWLAGSHLKGIATK